LNNLNTDGIVIGIDRANSVDIDAGGVAFDNRGNFGGLESGLGCVGIDYFNQLGSNFLV
jgi:hypothetical protein